MATTNEDGKEERRGLDGRTVEERYEHHHRNERFIDGGCDGSYQPCLHVYADEAGDWMVWLNVDRPSIDGGLVIGSGKTEEEALAAAYEGTSTTSRAILTAIARGRPRRRG